MTAAEARAEEARQDRIAQLKRDIEHIGFALDAFAAQADYADRQVELHEKRIKQLKRDLKEA